jgi:hypothetical protein
MSDTARAGKGFLQANAAPGVLFIAGALLFPAFLLQQDIFLRALQVGLFIVLNALGGKRIRIVQFLIVGAGIVVFNLVIPTGRVLLAPLGLPITEGALKSGLYKATAMTGLIALSQFSIRGDLRIPGRIGGLIGRTLFYFETIMAERHRIRRSDVIGSIDLLLIDVQAAGASGAAAPVAPRASSTAALLALALIVLGNWAAFALTIAYPHVLWG